MQKQMLRCDICGGTLKMQANREAICESCGMAYSIESLREKFDGLKVSVTGTKDDVEQWRALLRTYLLSFDYEAAENIVKKILEAVPTDTEANVVYRNLQSWRHFDIRNGYVIQYTGSEETVIIPDGVRGIHSDAFCKYRTVKNGPDPLANIRKIIIPKGIKEVPAKLFSRMEQLVCVELPPTVTFIGNEAFQGCRKLNKIELPDCIDKIGDYAFTGCSLLTTITLPRELVTIGRGAFAGCNALKEVYVNNNLASIGDSVFSYCTSLASINLPESLSELPDFTFSYSGLITITIPENIKTIGDGCFIGNSRLTSVHMIENTGEKTFKSSKINGSRYPVTFSNCPHIRRKGAITTTNPNLSRELTFVDGDLNEGAWQEVYLKIYDERTAMWLKNGKCSYCGGSYQQQTSTILKGIIPKKVTLTVCSICGKQKNYW